MTAKEEEEIRATKEFIFDRDNYTCICGESVYSKGYPQAAHIISKSKVNLKLYGKEIVHHPLNLVSTCSTECNQKVNIGTKPFTEAALVELIRNELGK
jgi:5-methylcytosine-specific restriction endonuclease McrA